ncbi:hypothetical protein J0H58_16665 [bacterium]|nr:hypothetical protein [bacterium]
MSFSIDAGFLPYLPKLEEYAEGRGLTLGVAARELVKQALDGPEPVAAAGPADSETRAELASVRESIRALEIATGTTAEEVRDRLDRLRDELAQVLRLAFLAFKDLNKDDVEKLLREVFGR